MYIDDDEKILMHDEDEDELSDNFDGDIFPGLEDDDSDEGDDESYEIEEDEDDSEEIEEDE